MAPVHLFLHVLSYRESKSITKYWKFYLLNSFWLYLHLCICVFTTLQFSAALLLGKYNNGLTAFPESTLVSFQSTFWRVVTHLFKTQIWSCSLRPPKVLCICQNTLGNTVVTNNLASFQQQPFIAHSQFCSMEISLWNSSWGSSLCMRHCWSWWQWHDWRESMVRLLALKASVQKGQTPRLPTVHWPKRSQSLLWVQ